MARLFQVKSVLLLLGIAGFVGGWKAAHYPGPPVERAESHRIEGGGVSSTHSIGPDFTYPLLTISYGFLGFGAVCVLATAWVHVAEAQAAGRRCDTASRAEGWEPVAEDVG